MVSVTVKLYGVLEKFSKEKGRKVTIDLPVDSNAGELMNALNIPKERVTIVLVNGEPADQPRGLKEADEVELFPPVSGG